ncbi:2OG-Fe(II) oxygenase [Burkholderia pseudomallei]|uniref:2OG-Fe(II) oxygenase n=1 Tax=Burkholderia pseudomallei TaxID=28450 RepID=UPI0003D90532|nr:2OG-Fe(II) oxygenase [Burkholderia pseudomallei]AHE31602.1 2OG-Fe(II) oxygenase superfamily protein [Burkholderia pseudomallei NCTC 13178]KGC47233.1 2OG-Fe(II) oxygenase superfamily protein [Burkholderia pseudomallei]
MTQMPPSRSIVERLLRFNEELNEAERANFQLLLGLAAGGLTPSFERPLEKAPAEAFDAVCSTLTQLKPYKDRLDGRAIVFRGRPDLMTDELLWRLQEESRQLRHKALRFDEHFLGCGAPIANELAVSPELKALVRSHAGDVDSTGVASFLFYDEPGQGISPHIDTDIFSLNVILMLEHQSGSQDKSALVVFPPGAPPERLHLEPGEMVIFFAGSIAHGREPIKADEAVTILTFGFQPIGD